MTDEQVGASFSVVRGTPTDEELAALVAVLATLPGPAEPVPAAPATLRPGGWSSFAWGAHAPLAPGPGAWLASARRL